MNKRELIEHIGNTLDKYLKNTTFVKPVLSITETANSDEVSLEFEIGKNCILLDDVSYRFGYDKGKLEGEWVGLQLKDADKIRLELNKPVIPQFVADWIEECKNDDFHLFGAMEEMSLHQKKLDYWFREDDNMELFARAWLDGYTVEEKRYRVVMPNISTTGGVLTRIKHDDSWIWIDTLGTIVEGRTHTRKELEKAGFGWVFDCPGIEIVEVE